MSKKKRIYKIIKDISISNMSDQHVLSCFIIFLILYIVYQRTIFLTLYVTFMTLSYHFIMRCLVGETIDFLYKKVKERVLYDCTEDYRLCYLVQ